MTRQTADTDKYTEDKNADQQQQRTTASEPPSASATASSSLSLSLPHFRDHLLHSLQQQGTLTSIKSQLKAQIIQKLLRTAGPASAPSSHYYANNPPSLIDRVALSLIAEYLTSQQLTNTKHILDTERKQLITEQLTPEDAISILRWKQQQQQQHRD